MGIKMIVLSMLALMAYNCMFPLMHSEPLAYLLHLIYFRSRHCEKQINWADLGIPVDFHIDVDLPTQASAVTRTFVIAVHYLVLNLLLTLVAIACLCESHNDLSLFNPRKNFAFQSPWGKTRTEKSSKQRLPSSFYFQLRCWCWTL